LRQRSKRDGQGEDVDGHLQLGKHDDDQWQPRRLGGRLIGNICGYCRVG
jgi:hypothetical protein